jgi:enoyl-CoA hydratase
VVASAVPGYFSAGADLNVFKGLKGEGMRQWAMRCHDIVHLLRASPKPLLAAIHGTAVGGGLEITLHCDLRFARPTRDSASRRSASASSPRSPRRRRWPA